MPGHDIVVIGASAGGIEALKRLVGGLPADFPGSLFIVLHVWAHAPPMILGRAGALPVLCPEDGAKIERGRIYAAPADQHMLVEKNHLRIVRGPKENRHRPAIDPLFRSAAWSFGPRVVGVVLSGTLDDGAAGLWAVRTCGGVAVVQDPNDAQFPDMPAAAMSMLEVDYRLPAVEIPALLIRLATQPVKTDFAPPHKFKLETEYVTMDRDINDMNQLGQPSVFTCPACRGALWEIQEGKLTRYRCHIGHAFSPDSLLDEQAEALEFALDSALRATEEKSAGLLRLAARLENQPKISNKYRQEAGQLAHNIELIKEMLARAKTNPMESSRGPHQWMAPKTAAPEDRKDR
jgi:two-component system chemotaxis response regulator CheB